jgi:hypothetical protein
VNTAVRAEQLERDQALGLINADAERSMLARLSPRRNPWREIATFDEQVAELERQKAEGDDRPRTTVAHRQAARRRTRRQGTARRVDGHTAGRTADPGSTPAA